MTQEEINDYNRRCAEFLGYKLITPEMRKNPETWKVSYWQKDYPNRQDVLCSEKYLSFHSDWNWIMEMVEAIEATFTDQTLQWEYDEREEFAESGKYKAYWFTVFPKDEICKGLFDLKSKTRKEAVVQAIYQFLIWYNKNK